MVYCMLVTVVQIFILEIYVCVWGGGEVAIVFVVMNKGITSMHPCVCNKSAHGGKGGGGAS